MCLAHILAHNAKVQGDSSESASYTKQGFKGFPESLRMPLNEPWVRIPPCPPFLSPVTGIGKTRFNRRGLEDLPFLNDPRFGLLPRFFLVMGGVDSRWLGQPRGLLGKREEESLRR